ncbi:MAG: hypothetical protein ACRDOZ_07970, partial [Nocardioides sp.]
MKSEMLNGTIMRASSGLVATVVTPRARTRARMRGLSSNSHRFPTLRRIMGVMGVAWKVVLSLVLVLPMTAYVVGSLVAAADEPREHAPIIIEERSQAPDNPRPSPSEKPTKKPSDNRSDRGDDHGGDDESDGPDVVFPSPSEFDDDDDDEDHSGPGGGGDDADDNSGKGSDDD